MSPKPFLCSRAREQQDAQSVLTTGSWYCTIKSNKKVIKRIGGGYDPQNYKFDFEHVRLPMSGSQTFPLLRSQGKSWRTDCFHHSWKCTCRWTISHVLGVRTREESEHVGQSPYGWVPILSTNMEPGNSIVLRLFLLLDPGPAPLDGQIQFSLLCLRRYLPIYNQKGWDNTTSAEQEAQHFHRSSKKRSSLKIKISILFTL